MQQAEDLFSSADDNFRLFYKDQKKDDKWEWTLQDALENASDDTERAEIQRLIEIRKVARFD